MGRMYTISFQGIGVTAVQDLFEVLTPADAVMALHRLKIGQSSDAGDAESEQLQVALRRVTGSPTSGSGGVVATPRPLSQGDAAAGITAEVDNTTQLTGGTNVILDTFNFNIMAGLDNIWTPEDRPTFSPSTRALVTLDATPGDALTMDGTMTIEEIGG